MRVLSTVIVALCALTASAFADPRIFEAAYHWAYSTHGMDLTSEEARQFAETIDRTRNPARTLSCYQEAFSFAYSVRGMNLSKQGARVHADQTCFSGRGVVVRRGPGAPSVVRVPRINTTINNTLFEAAYQWAYSVNGLNLSSSEAGEFAHWLVSLTNDPMAFENYKSAYAWGYSAQGLNLSSRDARAFAGSFLRRDGDRFLICYKEAYAFAYSVRGMNLSSYEARAYAENRCLR